MFSMTITIRKKAWMSNPRQRWNAGLERAGMNFRTGLSRAHYPPYPPGSASQRSYQTADKASFRIIEPGRMMEFGSTFYLPFLLYGTKNMDGWPGKRDELVDLMKRGFISGIKEYSE